MTKAYELVLKIKDLYKLKSDKDVADKLHIDPSHLGHWKHGRAQPNVENYLKLMQEAGIEKVSDALLIVTERPATSGGGLVASAKQCILCKIKKVNLAVSSLVESSLLSGSRFAL